MTKSSSSMARASCSGSGSATSSTLPWAFHRPLGSMSTCSTLREVLSKMSLTYLSKVSCVFMHHIDTHDLLINCKSLVWCTFAADRTQPLRALLLQLKVRGGVKTLHMGACGRAAGRDKSHVRKRTFQRKDLGRHLNLSVMRFPRNCKGMSVRDPVNEKGTRSHHAYVRARRRLLRSFCQRWSVRGCRQVLSCRR